MFVFFLRELGVLRANLTQYGSREQTRLAAPLQNI